VRVLDGPARLLLEPVGGDDHGTRWRDRARAAHRSETEVNVEKHGRRVRGQGARGLDLELGERRVRGVGAGSREHRAQRFPLVEREHRERPTREREARQSLSS
jgi:hypothetical protein